MAWLYRRRGGGNAGGSDDDDDVMAHYAGQVSRFLVVTALLEYRLRNRHPVSEGPGGRTRPAAQAHDDGGCSSSGQQCVLRPDA